MKLSYKCCVLIPLGVVITSCSGFSQINHLVDSSTEPKYFESNNSPGSLPGPNMMTTSNPVYYERINKHENTPTGIDGNTSENGSSAVIDAEQSKIIPVVKKQEMSDSQVQAEIEKELTELDNEYKRLTRNETTMRALKMKSDSLAAKMNVLEKSTNEDKRTVEILNRRHQALREEILRVFEKFK